MTAGNTQRLLAIHGRHPGGARPFVARAEHFCGRLITSGIYKEGAGGHNAYTFGETYMPQVSQPAEESKTYGR